MSSFLYRSGDNRRLFNYTPKKIKAYENRVANVAPQQKDNIPYVGDLFKSAVKYVKRFFNRKAI